MCRRPFENIICLQTHTGMIPCKITQIIYIFSICNTYMFRSCFTIFRVRSHRASNTTYVHSSKVYHPQSSLYSTTQCTQDILSIYTQLFNLFNFNFNCQHITRCWDCGEYIYKQLHLGRMHILLYYLLCNSAP